MKQTIFEEVEQIFRTIFEDDSLKIRMDLTADEVAMWDSLTHLALISEIENHFGITISFIQLMAFKNVGDLIDCVEKNLLTKTN